MIEVYARRCWSLTNSQFPKAQSVITACWSGDQQGCEILCRFSQEKHLKDLAYAHSMKIAHVFSVFLACLLVACQTDLKRTTNKYSVDLSFNAYLDTSLNKQNKYNGFYQNYNFLKDTIVSVYGNSITGSLYFIDINYMAPQLPISVFLFKMGKNYAICTDAETPGEIDFTKSYKENNPITYKHRIVKTVLKNDSITLIGYLKKNSLEIQHFNQKNTNKQPINLGLGIQVINKHGSLLLNDRKYIFSVNTMLKKNRGKKEINTVRFFDSSLAFNNQNVQLVNVTYTDGDTLLLGGRFFTIDSIPDHLSKIYLSEIEHKGNSKEGLEVFNHLPISNGQLLENTNKTIRIGGKQEKYTLIDFWGTWCQPCIELTEELKAMERQYKQRINLISIACDFNRADVLKHVNGHQMNWTHVYEEFTTKPLSIKYKVDAYPTFILLSPSGEILYRGVGKEGFYRLENFLKSLSDVGH